MDAELPYLLIGRVTQYIFPTSNKRSSTNIIFYWHTITWRLDIPKIPFYFIYYMLSTIIIANLHANCKYICCFIFSLFTSTVLLAQVRKSPNVAQPNGISDNTEKELHFSGPSSAIRIVFVIATTAWSDRISLWCRQDNGHAMRSITTSACIQRCHFMATISLTATTSTAANIIAFCSCSSHTVVAFKLCRDYRFAYKLYRWIRCSICVVFQFVKQFILTLYRYELQINYRLSEEK